MIRQLRHFTQAHRLKLAIIMGQWMILVNEGFEANGHFPAKLWWQATRSEMGKTQTDLLPEPPG
jgi:hypothetical protein